MISNSPDAWAAATTSAAAPGRWRHEVVLVLAVFLASALWATWFWNDWTAKGGRPEFYQAYFEPAVMVACGKGFAASTPVPKALDDFLSRRRDSFECQELPSDLKVGRDHLYQEAWIYLQYSVGWFWRVAGISWSGMGPVFGLFFGVVIALAYSIFRLGMSRPLAILGAIGMATSMPHLLNLPHLRDYSKAPFTLALVLIIGWLVTSPVRRSTVLLLSAAYGAVVGFGYGFRTDLLVNLPVLVVVLFVFLDGGPAKHLLLKSGATAVFVATFLVVSWPITTAVYEKGGCQWHVALLGLQSPFEERLHLTPAPYNFGDVYADGYVIRGVQGYARRTEPDGPIPQYCSHEYDVQSGRLLLATLTSFPGDFLTRAYASVLQIVELPFRAANPDVRQWAWGAVAVTVAWLLCSAVSLRLGLFLVFIVAYFGAYPAIQFQERHYFHLEFIGWWAMGFVVHQVSALLRAWWRGYPDRPIDIGRMIRRTATVALLAAVVCLGLVGATRWAQIRQARQLFSAYVDAPKTPLDLPFGPLSGVAQPDWPQFIEVALDEAHCGSRPAVTFQYDRANPDGDFTRTITIARRSPVSGTTRIFLPVFERYSGIAISDASPGCFVGAWRLSDLSAFPLLLGVTLSPDWEKRPLYQRLAQWESDAEPLALHARLVDNWGQAPTDLP